MTAKLKPCPFCGSTWVETGRTQDGYWFVECNERWCHAMLMNSKWAFEHEQDAIAAWNRRVKE